MSDSIRISFKVAILILAMAGLYFYFKDVMIKPNFTSNAKSFIKEKFGDSISHSAVDFASSYTSFAAATAASFIVGLTKHLPVTYGIFIKFIKFI